MFWKKKNTNDLFIHYNPTIIGIQPEEILVPAMNFLPKWWMNLKGNLVSSDEDLAHMMADMQVLSTAKRCPSFIELFKKSFVIKTPCDLIIDIDWRQKMIQSRTNLPLIDLWVSPAWQVPKPDEAPESSFYKAGFHDLSQLGEFNENLINIKFNINVFLTSNNEDLELIFMDPIYWKDTSNEFFMNLKTLPGILPLKKEGYPLPINTNCVLTIPKQWDNDRQSFVIRKDTVIGMLYSPYKKLSLKYKGDVSLINGQYDDHGVWWEYWKRKRDARKK